MGTLNEAVLSDVGDLSKDTALEPTGDGCYRAHLSREWEIWGPMGGYVAAIALRAAGAESPFDRPATFYCHYLGVAAFDDVEISVAPLRSGRTALSQRVSMMQGGRQILEATTWSTGTTEGLEHDVAVIPEVPLPLDLLSRDDLAPDRRAPFAFWDNLEQKPVQQTSRWPPDQPLEPEWQAWCRFRPVPTFEHDLWLDAARYLILLDVQSWPAAVRAHAWCGEPLGWIAPSLDLYVAFHQFAPEEQWLLADGRAPLSARGLFGWNGRVWTPGSDLVASAAGQAIYRPVP
jgi:acyl-CoA thioesterase II